MDLEQIEGWLRGPQSADDRRNVCNVAPTLIAEVRRLTEALQFYAAPWSAKDPYGEPIRVPDFYRDLEFESVAVEALAGRSALTPRGK